MNHLQIIYKSCYIFYSKITHHAEFFHAVDLGELVGNNLLPFLVRLGSEQHGVVGKDEVGHRPAGYPNDAIVHDVARHHVGFCARREPVQACQWKVAIWWIGEKMRLSLRRLYHKEENHMLIFCVFSRDRSSNISQNCELENFWEYVKGSRKRSIWVHLPHKRLYG